ncbi:MAG: hypothetical protein QM626_09400, partial [Microbacterium sp.]|uniref:acyl-CoA dehydrogenase family protein n=1 Tax=Microbacterium sp. TaxID=51671 RepID=UPI0039E3B21E
MLSASAAAIRDLAPEVEALVPFAEREGELGPELLGLLRDHELFRLAVPAELGGAGLDIVAQVSSVAALAESDGSAAFAVAMAAAAADTMPAAFLRRVYAGGRDVIVSGSGTPTRQAVAVDGGVRLSGRWPGVVGSAQADVVTVFFVLGEDEPVRRGRAYLPAASLVRRRTWAATGMRAAGSDTVLADDLVVPDEDIEWDDRSADPEPRASVLSVLPAAVAVGLAQGATRRAVAHAHDHPWAGTSYARAVDAPTVQVRLADAVMHADSAALHLRRAAAAIDAGVADAAPLDRRTR